MLFLIALLLFSVVECERFESWASDSRYYELSDQWEYLSKFSYTAKGQVKVTVRYDPTDPLDTANYVKLNMYQMQISTWKSKVMSLSCCEKRVALNTYSFDLAVEQTDTVEETRQCFTYYGETVCEITQTIDGAGSKGPWMFVSLSYCNKNLSEHNPTWIITSTNGGGILTKQSPKHDHHLFIIFLILTIFTIFFLLFWVFYRRSVPLNSRLLLPYKITMLITLLSFILFTAYFGKLNSGGVRNASLINAALLFLLLSSSVLIQCSLGAVWSGSTQTVHLSRWKSVLSFILSGILLITITSLSFVEFLNPRQTDVYMFDDQDRYLIWGTTGVCFAIWLAYTVPMAMNLTSSGEHDKNLPVLYFLFSAFLLGTPGSAIIANLNLHPVNRKLFVYTSMGVLHLLCYLFLFYSIRQNHTFATILHWFKKNFQKCGSFCGCATCCGGDKTSKNRSGAHGNISGHHGNEYGRRGTVCGSLCNLCHVMCPCCPCCTPNKNKDRYTSQTDLRKVFVEAKDHNDDFTLKIGDVEDGPDRVRTPETIIQSEPIVITNYTAVRASSPDLKDGRRIDIEGATSAKVLPWLYQDKHQDPLDADLTQRQRYDSHRGDTPNFNVKEHGYRSPGLNHWSNGNFRPFATSHTNTIMLYNKPEGMFSPSGSSFDRIKMENSERGISRYASYQDPSTNVTHANIARLISDIPTSHSSQNSPDPYRKVKTYNDTRGSGDTFDTNAYNSVKLRDEKAKVTTMRYRRNTLKGNLANVPTSMLLERVPVAVGTAKSSTPLTTPRIKVVQSVKPTLKLERSKSSLWKMLAKKYSGAPPVETNEQARLRRAIRAFRVNKTHT